MTRLAKGAIALAAASLPVILYAYAGGADPRYSGAPGDNGTCTACHGGIANTNGGNVTATFSSGTTYTPGGGPVSITVNVTDTNASHGFQMTARLASNLTNGQAGRFDTGSGTIVLCDDGSNRSAPKNGGNCPMNFPVEFIDHSTPRTGAWTFTWTPPATNAGNVHFYIAGNAVNGNGSADDGDHVYTNSYVLTPAGGVSQTPDNALVLAQLVGGGTEWRTTFFVTNLSSTAEDFTLRFHDDAGLPKSIPMDALGTVDTITGTLAPAQTRRFETGASGILQVAWALLIPGTPSTNRLAGLAVFRQTVPSGMTTVSSEAVVDFLPSTGNKYVLLYDNLNGFDTTAMLANPDALNQLTILADIRDEQGVLLGTDQIVLPPLGHTAFILRERFPSTLNQRGSIRLAVSPGGFAGAGLRFSPIQTFTSFRFQTSTDIQ